MELQTNWTKVAAVVMTVLVAALSALVGTGVLSAAAAGVVGGLLAVLNAALGYLGTKQVRALATAAKAGRRA
jgi:hypothetical protein